MSADNYIIRDVEYDVKGITRPYAIETKVLVDKKLVFKNEDELIDYINDYAQKLENTRVFEKISVDFSLKEHSQEETESGENTETLYDVYLNVSTKDSKHLLAVPYPKYDSNNGFSLRLKAKDTNFLQNRYRLRSVP